MVNKRQRPNGSSFLRSPAQGLAILGVTVVVAAMTVPRAGAADEPSQLRVLIYSGLNNHDWRSTTPVIQKTLRDCRRFGVVDVTEDPAGIDKATFARYDVIVSNWTPYPETRRSWPPQTETAFLDFIRGGGGFVVIHAAACTFQTWPDFQQLIALTWKADYTAHGAYHTFPVVAEDREHPIAKGLGDFYTTDELYHNMVQMTDQPLHVVFKAFSAKEQGGTGKHEPALVCTKMGRGRGVNLVLGHDAAAMGAGFKTLLLRSAEWAATGNVTIPPPAIWPATPAAMDAAGIDIDATFEAVARYQYGGDRKPLLAILQLVRYAGVPGADDVRQFRARLVNHMTSLLTSKAATSAAKVFVCGQLAAIATEEQAPALASLASLFAEKGDKELAQTALGALAQVPGPAVDRVLRDALGTSQGDLKIGVVNALGQRRDRGAAEPLIAMLSDTDEALACAAGSALGRIGGDAAVAALQKALASAKGQRRAEVADACLACAEQLLAEKKNGPAAAVYAQLSAPSETQQVRMAALRGTVLSDAEKAVAAVCEGLASGDPALESMAIQLVPEVPGSAATEQFAQCLGKTSPAVQTLLLRALEARRDTTARGPVEAAISSQDPTVRLAALSALGACGDETSVKMLVDRIVAGSETAEGQAARSSLVRMRGPRVNEVLAGMIVQRETPVKVELIRILAARNGASEVSDLKKAAEDPDAAVRKESWKAIGGLARGQDVASLVDLLVRTREDELEDAEKAVAAALKRSDQPDLRALLQRLESVPPPRVQITLLRILSAVGDDRALPSLRKAAQSSDAGVRDAAVRGLTAWPSPVAFEDLVNLARQAEDSVHRALALGAAIRLSSKAQGRTPEQMTGLIGELMQLARDAAARKAVLAELGRCTTLDALRVAQKYLADPELATEAGVAVTQIASSIRQTHRDEVLRALQPLVAGDRDPVVVGRAAKVLKDILKPANLALGATATSPDGLDSDGSSRGDGAAIDGDVNTYWDEVDGADLYRLKVTFREPTDVSSINLLWHPYEQHQATNFDIVCDGKVVKEVRKAKCFENEMLVTFAPVRCTSVGLVIPGKNGLVSPCIHEFQIFGPFPSTRTFAPQQ